MEENYRFGYAVRTSRANARSIETVTTEVVDSAAETGTLGVGEGGRLCVCSVVPLSEGEVRLGSTDDTELNHKRVVSN